MEINDSIELQSNSKRARFEVDLANLPTNPGLRKKISDYHPSDRDKIRRAHLQKKKKKKKNLQKHGVVLIQHGSKNILTGWNTTF